jgi:hypothetical protein
LPETREYFLGEIECPIAIRHLDQTEAEERIRMSCIYVIESLFGLNTLILWDMTHRNVHSFTKWTKSEYYSAIKDLVIPIHSCKKLPSSPVYSRYLRFKLKYLATNITLTPPPQGAPITMKNYLKNITIGALTMIVVASPLISFAKENENRGKGSHDSRKEQSRDDDKKNISTKNSCIRAYGHFFAFGWNKKNSISDEDRAYIAANCRFPFGISKKFHGYNATTTPDVTAPVISNITSNAGKVQADIRWSTNEYTDSVVFWNTSSTVDTSDTASNRTINTRLTKNHQVILKNLIADTTYYFIVHQQLILSSLSSVL